MYAHTFTAYIYVKDIPLTEILIDLVCCISTWNRYADAVQKGDMARAMGLPASKYPCTSALKSILWILHILNVYTYTHA